MKTKQAPELKSDKLVTFSYSVTLFTNLKWQVFYYEHQKQSRINPRYTQRTYANGKLFFCKSKHSKNADRVKV